jgi:hypothetical integral membrane protein (TIGR02206 family)
VVDDADYFWALPSSQVPPQLGFGGFSVAHLASLAVLGLVAALVVWGYRRVDPTRRRGYRLGLGLAVLGLELFHQVAFLVAGAYTASILPLHLCAVATCCVVIDSVKPNSWCREFGYALGTWGPAAALLFPDWANLPIVNIHAWQAFLVHALILAYPLMLLVSGEFRPDPRQLWKPATMVVVCVGLSLLANQAWGTNFWFLNTGSPGSPLEPIQQLAGPFYLPVLAVLVAIVWTALYLPWRRRGKRPASAAG